MQSMILMEKEIKHLRATNKKQLRKRKLSRKQIERTEGMFAHETYEQGISLPGGIEGGGVSSAAPTQTASVTGDGTNRRQIKCSICGKPSHRAKECLDRV